MALALPLSYTSLIWTGRGRFSLPQRARRCLARPDIEKVGSAARGDASEPVVTTAARGILALTWQFESTGPNCDGQVVRVGVA